MPNMFDPQLGVPQQPDFSLWGGPQDEGSIIDRMRARTKPQPTFPQGGGEGTPAPLDPAVGNSTLTSSGITMPAPHVATPVPPTHAQPMSRAGRLRESIIGALAGDSPQGYESFLTPDEIKAARPSLLQSLFPAADEPHAASRWQHNLDTLVQHKQLAVAAQRAQQLQSERAKVEHELGAAPEDEEGFAKWARRAYGKYASIGDMDSVQKLNVVMQQIVAADHKAGPIETSWEDVGGSKVLTDKRTGKVITSIPKTPAPKTASEVDAGMKFGADQKNKILDDYARDTKDFHQVMAGWDVLKGATKDPTLATPFAITDAYARITNPGAIVRPTTMEMIDKMGSVGQRMRKYWEHNAEGQLPPDIMRDFQKTLYAIVKEHKDQYDSIRKQALTRAEQSKIPRSEMDALLQNYNIEDPLAPTAKPDFTKFGVTPVRKP